MAALLALAQARTATECAAAAGAAGSTAIAAAAVAVADPATDDALAGMAGHALANEDVLLAHQAAGAWVRRAARAEAALAAADAGGVQAAGTLVEAWTELARGWDDIAAVWTGGASAGERAAGLRSASAAAAVSTTAGARFAFGPTMVVAALGTGRERDLDPASASALRLFSDGCVWGKVRWVDVATLGLTHACAGGVRCRGVLEAWGAAAGAWRAATNAAAGGVHAPHLEGPPVACVCVHERPSAHAGVDQGYRGDAGVAALVAMGMARADAAAQQGAVWLAAEARRTTAPDADAALWDADADGDPGTIPDGGAGAGGGGGDDAGAAVGDGHGQELGQSPGADELPPLPLDDLTVATVCGGDTKAAHECTTHSVAILPRPRLRGCRWLRSHP
jgi:hypothetical protein